MVRVVLKTKGPWREHSPRPTVKRFLWEVAMQGRELMDAVSRCLNRPLEGLVLRTFVRGRALVHRVSPEEWIDLEAYSEVVALIPLLPAEVARVIPGEEIRLKEPERQAA